MSGTHTPLAPFAAWAGPHNPRVLLVGEAWGESEAMTRQPFVGASGKELWRLLGQVWPEAPEAHSEALRAHRYGDGWIGSRDPWLNQTGVAFTNVLALRPPSNNLDMLCESRTVVGKDYPLSSLSQGKYLKWEYLPELARLRDEIALAQPTLVVPLGATACWALLGRAAIGSLRGTVVWSEKHQVKCLPTYHPAAFLRNWSYRAICHQDLLKASRERWFPEVRRPARELLINPTLDEVRQGADRLLREAKTTGLPLSNDVETEKGQITCISFSVTPQWGMVVPFWHKGKPGWHYWERLADEQAAWRQVRRLLESPGPKLGQNYIYDLQYITACPHEAVDRTKLGIRPQNCTEDTMLLHHSAFPEMQKGLGFLGSIYTDEPAWKLMRRRRADTEKRDE